MNISPYWNPEDNPCYHLFMDNYKWKVRVQAENFIHISGRIKYLEKWHNFHSWQNFRGEKNQSGDTWRTNKWIKSNPHGFSVWFTTILWVIVKILSRKFYSPHKDASLRFTVTCGIFQGLYNLLTLRGFSGILSCIYVKNILFEKSCKNYPYRGKW